MSNEFLLPTNFTPSHYKIWIKKLNIDENTFNGNVSILLKTNQASNVIQLHIRDITIENAWIETNDGDKQSCVSHSYDKVTEFLTLEFPNEITADCTLFVDYNGLLQSNMSGFYRSNYKDVSTGDDKWMLSTQFEATDARRAFPCFDEPNLKAHFEVHITAESELTVLSNMPEKEELDEGSMKTHIFYTSPLMSTYLVAWAIGEFEYIESKTDKEIYPTLQGYSIEDGSSQVKGSLPIRLYTAKGKSQQGQFAMDVAKKVVDLFSELFEIPYPLPKLDLICVESYSHNAMENFSLITFRPSALLYDGDIDSMLTSSASKKIAYVVSHEIAHQWFGNLVTMNWWDELWLNEGFATWVGYYAVNHLFPDWNVPSMIMLNSREVALGLDSLHESHPVKVNVHDPKDIDQVFDTISYLKGCSVLEMISGYLGEVNFLRGVAIYLKRNKFGNATMEDLFSCISEVADIEMLSRVKPWILDIGFPKLSVEKSSKDSNLLRITQNRYVNSTSDLEKSSDKKTNWWIPLMMTKGNVTEGRLEFDSEEIDIGYEESLTFFNTDGYGFYRVKYESSELLDKIYENLENLSSRSLMALISDVATCGTLRQFLDLSLAISKLKSLNDYYVWKLIIQYLETMRIVVFNSCDASLITKFDKFICSLFEPIMELAISYLQNPTELLNNKDDEFRYAKAELYDAVLELTGMLGQSDVVKAAMDLFEKNSINDSNRSIVFSTVLSQKNTKLATFEKIAALVAGADLAELETILSCLGCVRNEELFTPCLDLLFKIEPMNVQYLATSFGKNPYIQSSILKYVESKKTELFQRLQINAIVMCRFVSFTFCNFSEASYLNSLNAIFKGEDISLYDRNLKQTMEHVELNISHSKEWIPQLTEYFM
ncbi:hypothetical protein Kpol_380p14 [Vanderwaltozyma polyspora DSM 70294]|uniref:Aminopeptidase n=1 Tax=Vanderwaltozyma polyspora (strain ATCC 22028 / DSM 70294 / BCRC 21397 / CBS 2163 / NBRC 10782 / NRRL Y-8283 / UCD 57-17) TaxID=436907 RepID=A7TS73_VANPO|nr:uncharacterized protein Kpol_380p14 [Vanderwaltozyma polyspora DSM 70294]EDO14895.1 hypothetical protein Kpol_380p14 [Vanderwaltozyma polyspora DSM 70294]